MAKDDKRDRRFAIPCLFSFKLKTFHQYVTFNDYRPFMNKLESFL